MIMYVAKFSGWGKRRGGIAQIKCTISPLPPPGIMSQLAATPSQCTVNHPACPFSNWQTTPPSTNSSLVLVQETGFWREDTPRYDYRSRWYSIPGRGRWLYGLVSMGRSNMWFYIRLGIRKNYDLVLLYVRLWSLFRRQSQSLTLSLSWWFTCRYIPWWKKYPRGMKRIQGVGFMVIVLS